MGQPGAPKWIRYVLVWLGSTLISSVLLVVLALDPDKGPRLVAAGVTEKNASLIGPAGALVAVVALAVATLQQRRARVGKG